MPYKEIAQDNTNNIEEVNRITEETVEHRILENDTTNVEMYVVFLQNILFINFLLLYVICLYIHFV